MNPNDNQPQEKQQFHIKQQQRQSNQQRDQPREQREQREQPREQREHQQFDYRPNQQNKNQQPAGQIKTKKLYYKYCCNSCIHLENSNKSCVCIVPRSKRKKTIGQEGCQTCKCTGCTAEDELIRNQQERKRKRQKREREQRSRSRQGKFNPQNGCCKKCIRALSKNRKACLCQVPKNVRKTKLPSEGCKLCGCHGCHPRDHNEKYEYSSEQYSDYDVSGYNESQNNNQKQEHMNNVQQSVIGQVIANQYNLYGPMLGLGIPQRTPSYILGRPV